MAQKIDTTLNNKKPSPRAGVSGRTTLPNFPGTTYGSNAPDGFLGWSPHSASDVITSNTQVQVQPTNQGTL